MASKDTAPARRFKVKRMPDGRALLNLGSSARVAPGWNNVDFSWLVRLGRHRQLCSALHEVGLLNAQRYQRIQAMDPDTVLWDLSRGIPFEDRTFDVCYHSHVLEHLDREQAPGFIAECVRVLRPGGILRVVVPDLEGLARDYLDVMARLPGRATMDEHTAAVAAIFDQMVLRVPRHRAAEPWVVRAVENALIGDTARAGILHRWMYDRHSLAHLFRQVGLVDATIHTHATSGVPEWADFRLDTEPDGTPYKPGSVYVEAHRA